MQPNEVRYYLHNLEGLDNKINRLQQDIVIYKGMGIEYVMTTKVTDMPKAPMSSITSKVEIEAVRRADYIKKLEQRLNEYVQIRSAILNVLDGLKELDKEIIRLKYLHCEQGQRKCSYSKIANILHYCENEIKRREYNVIINIIKCYFTQ